MLAVNWKHNLKIYFIAIAGIVCSVFFCKPHNSPIELVKAPPFAIKFESLLIKKSDLTNNLDRYPPETHEAKGVFRLTVPVIMKALNITTLPQLYFLQLVVGVLLYLVMAALAYQSCHSYKSALAIIIAISATYFGRAFFLDTYPWLDTFAFFFAALAIWARKYIWVVVPAIVALFFTDERGAICTGIVFVSIKLFEQSRVGDVTFKELFSFKGYGNRVLFGILIAVSIRVVLMFCFHMSTPSGQVGLAVFFNQWKTFQLGLFYGLIGLWGVFFMAVLHAVANKKWLFVAIIVSFTAIFMLVSASVHDITRSIIYLIPLVFVCIKYLSENLTGLGYSLAGIAFINLMMPHGFVIKDMVFNNTGYPYLFDMLFKIKSMLGL